MPPWWLVRRRVQRDRSHRLMPNHRLGFRLGSAALVGSLVGLVFRSVGLCTRAVSAGVTPSCVGYRGPSRGKDMVVQGSF